MSTITIPKKITQGTELVIIPIDDYERLLERQVPEFAPTLGEKRDLARARKNRAQGKYLTIHELKQKLGFTG